MESAYTVIVGTRLRLLSGIIAQLPQLEEVLAEGLGRHPDAEIYTSQPGLGVIRGARVLAEFGDDPHRYRDAKSGKRASWNSRYQSPVRARRRDMVMIMEM
ncbi:hypothetical protein [Pseudonocardia asaccharolytica]|uniref:IS110 family transposase n=1 Tax=Pseudonocardia asaccharolytica DSM 44247 = NBRC 16224 TaxID=1123024 RepID=A0A511D7X4_9PSEU|nr:hypothetical protein [Pseudonocardia asaccharolytica]GEL19734.1 hypothetical protein PA7_35710 [Pseudonocardia asaccharolytica DSM 44247 = NBRC 16224]